MIFLRPNWRLFFANGWLRCGDCGKRDFALASLDSDNNIDLVISDLHMPEISGLDLLALLRAQHWSKPFILLSANEVTASDVAYDRWVKKDENLAENLGAAVNALLQPPAVTK